MKPEDFGIKDYEWVKGKLNVNSSVNLEYKNLRKLPFDFGVVEGNFFCENNRLKSLKGAPEVVLGDFDCSYNKLKSLNGAPKKIEGDFDCSNNTLENLEGAPQEGIENFQCHGCNLESLEGMPRTIGGDLKCGLNNLTSFKGAPEEVVNLYAAMNEKLVSLEGLPKVFDLFTCISRFSLFKNEFMGRWGRLKGSNFNYGDVKTVVVDGKLPEEYTIAADRFVPGWREKLAFENKLLQEEDDDLIKALEKVSK